METLNRLIAKTARPAELILAIIFIIGALLKAADINRFVVQITHYGVLGDRAVISLVALATVGLEIAIGVALLLKLRLRGLLYVGILGMLVVFTGLILYGWLFNDLKDCGCFGKMEMSPQVSVAKNVLLVALLVAAWLGVRHEWRAPVNWRRFGMSAPAVILAALGASGYSYAHVQKPAAPEERRFAEFVFNEDGQTTDLGKGTYLVAILRSGCTHCMDSVPQLNALRSEPGLPPLVGLCFEETQGGMAEFAESTGAEFPLFSMGTDEIKFFSLIGDAPPRVSLVRDGVQIKYWDEAVPEASEVTAAMAGKSSDASK